MDTIELLEGIAEVVPQWEANEVTPQHAMIMIALLMQAVA